MRCRAIISLLIPVLLAGCGKGPVSEPTSRELTVLIGTDGYGDGSYNDTMLEGILGFCKDHPDVSLSLQQPESIADAGKRLDAWLSKEGSGDRALILVSNTYEDILKGKPAPKNGRVLILETDDVFRGIPPTSSAATAPRGSAEPCPDSSWASSSRLWTETI